MAWTLVPLTRRDFGFFDRQRSLFGDWLHAFDDEWRAMDFDSSLRQFDRSLEQLRKEMYQMDRLGGGEQAAGSVDVETRGPFVTDAEGNRKMTLRFDVSQFKPEEVSVKTMDGNLVVHAKHIEESEGHKVHREFTRHYTLPQGVDPKALKSTLSGDGVLQVEAPAPPAVEAPKEYLVPIEKL